MENEFSKTAVDKLEAHFRRYPQALVLTGAGCSTGSGIPDYRDENGDWKHNQPILYQDFVKSRTVRQRYWAGSMHGWPRIVNAKPNAAHLALARLEAAGFVQQIVTQNVDGLHQKAGSNSVIDLHGRLDTVACIDCHHRMSRDTYQYLLLENNPAFIDRLSVPVPDGDARLAVQDYSSFRFPDCPLCGGICKPDVIFFGEFIPKQRVSAALRAMDNADSLVIVGSSLMVLSGYRFCRTAREQGKPMVSINIGRSRADQEFSLKIEQDCCQILSALTERLDATRWCNQG